jgi:hypothetical protein
MRDRFSIVEVVVVIAEVVRLAAAKAFYAPRSVVFDWPRPSSSPENRMTKFGKFSPAAQKPKRSGPKHLEGWKNQLQSLIDDHAGELSHVRSASARAIARRATVRSHPAGEGERRADVISVKLLQP